MRRITITESIERASGCVTPARTARRNHSPLVAGRGGDPGRHKDETTAAGAQQGGTPCVYPRNEETTLVLQKPIGPCIREIPDRHRDFFVGPIGTGAFQATDERNRAVPRLNSV